MGHDATVKCLDCDAVFNASPSGKGPRRTRCDLHRGLRKAQLQRARTAQLRAESWGVTADLVIAVEVFERDQWICHLCGDPVPEELRVSVFRAGTYEPLAPVVDHVIALAKGGPHMMENCRLAHWRCNAKKHLREDLGEVEAELDELPTAPHPLRPCSIAGCHREVKLKGMCQMHYRRTHVYGDPLKLKCACGCGEMVTVSPTWTGLFYIDGHGVNGNKAEDPAEKLRSRLVARPVSDRGRELHSLTDDCLLWTGSYTERGYGVISFRTGKRKMRGELAHRFAYELAFGAGSAAGLSVDHLCGVPLCCNPNHLEAVTVEENLRRAGLAVTECPQGHPYDEKNTRYSTTTGHRGCRQCTRNRYHMETVGHEFVLDPENPSSARKERCLACRLEKESTPQFCPYGHEYTPENKRINNGKRSCNQCIRDRTHIPQFGHSFVLDTSNPSTKRERCRVCVESAQPVTHCFHGHEYNELTLEFSPKGHRKCVQCRLNHEHVPTHGHEYVIDPIYKPGGQRRCLTCVQNKPETTHCVNGHEYTPENTKYHKTRGNRICVTCETNGFHVPRYGHEFVADPNHKGNLRRCLVCAETKQAAK